MKTDTQPDRKESVCHGQHQECRGAIGAHGKNDGKPISNLKEENEHEQQTGNVEPWFFDNPFGMFSCRMPPAHGELTRHHVAGTNVVERNETNVVAARYGRDAVSAKTQRTKKETQAMKRLLSVLMGVMGLSGVMAGNAPLQLSLTPDVALVDRSERIEGLTLNIWGENPQGALALGFVNGSTGTSAGLTLGLLNYADNYTGFQWAAVNYTGEDFLGWQLAFVNYTGGRMKGLQTGFVNYAGKLTGLQFGFVNFADSAETGVQIGLVNLISSNEWFTELPDELAPGMIFINWRF